MTTSITVQNNIRECEKLSEFLDKFADSNTLPDETRGDMRLIIEELFTNIVRYAYDTDTVEERTVQFDKTPHAINITFTDNGVEFNPATDCIKDIENDDHSKGGMGLHIIKTLGDKFEYKRIGDNNVFTVTKHYTHQQ